ncbi:MAG TPA: GNAT family N-acetyltransferase [Candidatus Elarobacter sp.]
MKSSTISGLADFEAERARWSELYRADPSGRGFLSWEWLRAALPVVRQKWQIVVVREGETLVAALPLATRPIPSRALPIASELSFATDPIADYQGMLCLPGREREAARAFAAAIRRMRWDRAAFGDVADDRFDLVLAELRGGTDATVTGETTCLWTALPADWESFSRALGRTTRQHTAQKLRKLTAIDGFRSTVASDADFAVHLEALLSLNHKRWGGNRNRQRAKYGRLFTEAHRTGALRLLGLWRDEQPIAACASFVDPVRGTYGFYQSGFEPAFAALSPGNVMVAVAIRDAIEHGYRVFDFLRGDEPYKRAFADQVTVTRHHRVRRRSVRASVFDAVQPTYHTLKLAAARVVYGPGRTV